MIPGAKKFTNQQRGQERSGRSVQEDEGVDAAKGGWYGEKKREMICREELGIANMPGAEGSG